jgi:DNA-binding NarL/FixJ family response regulator
MDDVSPGSYEIFVVDDHPLVRQEIRNIIEASSDLHILAELQDGLELLECLKRRVPHLIILDIAMPRLGGIEATRMIKASCPRTRVLILTLHNRREYLAQAVQAGAEGYLLKEELDKELLSAIAAIRKGYRYRSPLMRDHGVTAPPAPGFRANSPT